MQRILAAAKPRPSIEYLRECFDCNPQLGILIWRERPVFHFETPFAAKMWNAKLAGKEAGSREKIGYRQITITINGLQIGLRAHCIIWAIYTGVWPLNHIDHVNGEKWDDRIDNLRAATRAENMRNMRVHKNNVNGLKGVASHRNKFEARIKVGGKRIYLGVHDTPQQAHDAYCVAATKLHGAFARFS